MQIVEVNEARVAYRVDGQGPGLVLVHGAGADSQSNREQPGRRHCRVYRCRVPPAGPLGGVAGRRRFGRSIEMILTTNRWEGMSRQVELDLVFDIRESVGCVAKPTLVIGCTHDHMVPPAHARELANAIRGARYQEMATGHLAPLEDPDEFVRIIKSFLLG